MKLKSKSGDDCMVFRIFAYLMVLAGTVWMANVGHCQIVTNGSFEQPGSATDQYTVSYGGMATNHITSWLLGPSGVVSLPAQSPGGYDYDGISGGNGLNDAANYEDGSNCLFLQGGMAATTVTLSPGVYTLSFWAMGRVDGGNGANPVWVTVGNGGGIIFSNTVTPQNTAQNQLSDWTQSLFNFSVTSSGQYSLVFQSATPYGTGHDYMTFIDKVLINPSTPGTFSAASADATMDAYNAAYYYTFGPAQARYLNVKTNSSPTYFWGQAEEIEGLIDAYQRNTNTTYQKMINNLLNGFCADWQTNWSWDDYNDDVNWACIAFLRGYFATGNSSFLNIAKTNYDMMYARAWDTNWGGGLEWSTLGPGKAAAANGPGAMAAYLLYKALNDSTYLTKAQNIYNWEKSTLFNSTSGAISDGINSNGINTWASTYNQGTFVGIADYLGDTNAAYAATIYTMDYLSGAGNPGVIMFEYGTLNNNSGFNSIGIRWISKFVNDYRYQSEFLPWLQVNADTAWNVRRTADNLSWEQWLQQTPSLAENPSLNSWDFISSVAALQCVPNTVTNGVLPNGTYALINSNSGLALETYEAGTGNGTVLDQSAYSGGLNQQWNLTYIGNGQYSLIGVGSGRSANVYGGYATNDTLIIIWDYVAQSDEVLTLTSNGNGYYTPIFVNSDKAVTVNGASTNNGAKIIQYQYNGGTSAQWKFVPVVPNGTYEVLNGMSGLVLDAYDNGAANGTLLDQWTYNGGTNQQWDLTYIGNGQYSLIGVGSGRSVNVYGGYTTDNTQIILWDWLDQTDEILTLTNSGNGYFSPLFVNSGKAMTVQGNSTLSGASIVQYDYSAAQNAEWRFQSF